MEALRNNPGSAPEITEDEARNIVGVADGAA